jgi:hypothetical protein
MVDVDGNQRECTRPGAVFRAASGPLQAGISPLIINHLHSRIIIIIIIDDEIWKNDLLPPA